MVKTLRIVVLAVTLLLPLSATSPTTASADPCATGGPRGWFTGIVYDRAQRADFVLDVSNFEAYLSTLRRTYCIPSTAAEILAMEDGFTLDGTVYREASEANLKRTLRAFAGAADAGDTFFFFLSSHGIMDGPFVCKGGRRALGSLSGLKSGEHEDGNLLDCELGFELNGFDPGVRMAVYVDCSFCGGFSDSVTAVSGTIPDGSVPVASGILGAERVVVTGCAITTECFGGPDGGRLYGHMNATMSVEACDGWTAPGFPGLQGVDLPERTLPRDGVCGASEWHFAAVAAAYSSFDEIAIQQQFRIKYGPDSLADDIPMF